jgi:hypothetical protein
MTIYQIPNREVFELVDTAVQAIAEFLDQRDPEKLSEALMKLQSAKTDAAQNPLVLNCRAIIHDLLGQFGEALKDLELLKAKAGPAAAAIRDEIDSNIKVVNIHSKSEELRAGGGAAAQVEGALKTMFPEQGSSKVSRAHREALTARAFALQCVPSSPEHPDLKYLAASYAEAVKRADGVIALWPPLLTALFIFRESDQDDAEIWKQAKALAYNARSIR